VKKNQITLMSLVFCLAAMFFACQKDSDIASSATQKQSLSPQDQEMVDYLVQNGYKKEDVKVWKDGVTLEGCMYMDKATVKELMKNVVDTTSKSITLQTRQRAQFGNSLAVLTLTSTNVANIKYFVHSSVKNCYKGTEWVTAIAAAAKK
jgi:hypothetical protein